MIRTIQFDAIRQGPVYANLVEVTDDKTGDKTTDYEVGCDLIVCAKYGCTHLTRNEAVDEVGSHYLIHEASGDISTAETQTGD